MDKNCTLQPSHLRGGAVAFFVLRGDAENDGRFLAIDVVVRVTQTLVRDDAGGCRVVVDLDEGQLIGGNRHFRLGVGGLGGQVHGVLADIVPVVGRRLPRQQGAFRTLKSTGH